MAISDKSGSYCYYFSKILAKRLSYVNNVIIILSFLISEAVSLPFCNFWKSIIMSLVVKGPLTFIALFLVRLDREVNSTVNFTTNRTLGLQIIGTLLSKKFIKAFCYYLTSSLIIGCIYISQLPYAFEYFTVSKIYEQRSKANDEWIYFWYYLVLVAFIYVSQHFIFERNRLKFEYGVSKIKPEDSIIKNVPKLIANSILLNVVSSLVIPLSYVVFRSLVYKVLFLPLIIVGLDPSPSHLGLSLKGAVCNGFLSANVYISWEFINHVYEVYATIGCLDGNKPISTYSSDPLNTLLSGMRNMDSEFELSRLSAFQELAYIATSEDAVALKLRNSIYNTHANVSFIWLSIFDECSSIIKDYISRVNYRSPSDMAALKALRSTLKNEIDSSKKQEEIFGNSFSIGSNDTSFVFKPNISTHDSVFKKSKSPEVGPLHAFMDFINKKVTTLAKKYFTFDDNDKQRKNSTNSISIFYAKWYFELIALRLTKIKNYLLSKKLGILFRVTVKRDAESRVINPVIFGNSVVALANLIMHALEEDKKYTITNTHVAEVLNLLERAIRASSNYTDSLPASVYVANNHAKNLDSSKKHLIALLHDLTISEFFQICVKYNNRLNDLVLLPKTFQLAKWAIDVAITQQNRNQIVNKSS